MNPEIIVTAAITAAAARKLTGSEGETPNRSVFIERGNYERTGSACCNSQSNKYQALSDHHSHQFR